MRSPYPNKTMSLKQLLGHALPRLGLLGVLWFFLTDGHETSWGVGIPVLMAGTCASLLLRSPCAWTCQLSGLVRWFPVFLWISWRGGFDVALRAFHPHCPLAPGLLIYSLGLPIGPARIFFANTVSLLPGTLSADLEEDRLTVHVVDERLNVLEHLQSMEALVAALFGLQLQARGSSRSDRHD